MPVSRLENCFIYSEVQTFQMYKCGIVVYYRSQYGHRACVTTFAAIIIMSALTTGWQCILPGIIKMNMRFFFKQTVGALPYLYGEEACSLTKLLLRKTERKFSIYYWKFNSFPLILRICRLNFEDARVTKRRVKMAKRRGSSVRLLELRASAVLPNQSAARLPELRASV